MPDKFIKRNQLNQTYICICCTDLLSTLKSKLSQHSDNIGYRIIKISEGGIGPYIRYACSKCGL